MDTHCRDLHRVGRIGIVLSVDLWAGCRPSPGCWNDVLFRRQFTMLEGQLAFSGSTIEKQSSKLGKDGWADAGSNNVQMIEFRRRVGGIHREPVSLHAYPASRERGLACQRQCHS